MIPISRRRPTECCVGLVLISPEARRYGSKVRCMKRTFSRPFSSPNCRMASKKGRLSMSPTVPPISLMTTSTSSEAIFSMLALISLVMCGTTCTVDPR